MDKVYAQFGLINEEAKEKVLAAKQAIDVPEYRPRWVPSEFYSTSSALSASLAQMQAASMEGEQATTTLLSRSPRRMVVAVDMPAEGWVKLPHFYYPGWRAVTGEPATQLPVRPSTPEGLIEVNAGPGRQEILLELVTSGAERIGYGISGFSIALLGVFAFRAFRRH